MIQSVFGVVWELINKSRELTRDFTKIHMAPKFALELARNPKKSSIGHIRRMEDFWGSRLLWKVVQLAGEICVIEINHWEQEFMSGCGFIQDYMVATGSYDRANDGFRIHT